jgi:hypothetical protein
MNNSALPHGLDSGSGSGGADAMTNREKKVSPLQAA